MQSALKKIAPFISVLFFGLAAWFLYNELGQYSLRDITAYITTISPLQIGASLVLCALSYLLLTGYDALGVDYIGEDLSFRRIAKAGFIGYAFSHNIGMALVTGGSIRYRLYSAWGLSGLQVTKIVGFSAFTLWIGFCSTAGLSLLLYSPSLPDDLIPAVSLGVLGIILLVMVVAYLAGSALIKNEISIFGWAFKFPGFAMAVKQVVIASADWLLVSSVLFVLLPEAGIPFFGFVGVFLLAQIAGLFSQVPGGLGVFESIIVLYLTNFIAASAVVGILLVYRIIYYIIPLIVAMGMLGYQEYRANRRVVQEFGSRTANWFPRVVPTLFSVLIFIGGAVLLFSGAMPSEVPRMQWLQPLVPLPVIEMSHFFASLVGAMLLVLAHGLQRRIDAAWHATVAVLTFGILFSLLKGVSYVEAAILAVMLIALVFSRKQFRRRAALFSERFSPVWMTMILMVVVSSVWLGLFSYRNIDYQRELWWQFTLLGDAPRYLRASVAVLGGAIIFGLIKLLKPAGVSEEKTDKRKLKKARSLLGQSKRAHSNLLLMGDKRLLFSDDKKACIMYGVEDKSWISMGDPVGTESGLEDVVWKFNELSERNEGWPVFYQIYDDYLDVYEELDLTVIKLGEEARVKVPEFTLQGALQETHDAMASRGYRFEIIPPDNIASRYDALDRISEAWLAAAGHHEKRFSMGYMNRAYLKHFTVAAVVKEGELHAFCNLWSGAGHGEIGYDLLRFQPDAPSGVTEFLLSEAILWSKEQGYEWFNMGLAPLSEMDQQKIERRWAKFANQLYNYDEQLYNFEGLRHQKAKFNPHWEPMYLAAPGGLKLATVLTNLGELISGHRG